MRSFQVAILVSFASLLASCSKTQATTQSKTADPPPISQIQKVAVTTLQRLSLSRQVVLPGELKPYQLVDLHAKVAGYLRQITVDAGSRVSEGQLIATLEVPEFEADLAQNSADLSRIESELTRAKAELDRAESQLHLTRTLSSRLSGVAKTEPGLIARQELDEASAREKNAQAQVASSRAAIASVEHQIESAKASERRTKTMNSYTKILAPFAGIVIKRYADPGALIQAGTSSHTQAIPVVRLAQLNRLRFVATVPEAIVPLIRNGQPIELRIPSIQRSIKATVSRISNNVQLDTRTMEVEVDTPNPNQDLVPGMFAEALFTATKRDSAPAVPIQAVVSAGGNRTVLVVSKDGIVEQRQIQTGMESSSSMEILAGLTPDEWVVIGDRSLLKPGQKVEPKLTEAN
jgi:RND family efflux transporter MFP subunit